MQSVREEAQSAESFLCSTFSLFTDNGQQHSDLLKDKKRNIFQECISLRKTEGKLETFIIVFIKRKTERDQCIHGGKVANGKLHSFSLFMSDGTCACMWHLTNIMPSNLPSLHTNTYWPNSDSTLRQDISEKCIILLEIIITLHWNV